MNSEYTTIATFFRALSGLGSKVINEAAACLAGYQSSGPLWMALGLSTSAALSITKRLNPMFDAEAASSRRPLVEIAARQRRSLRG
jgi:hypothetical protein